MRSDGRVGSAGRRPRTGHRDRSQRRSAHPRAAADLAGTPVPGTGHLIALVVDAGWTAPPQGLGSLRRRHRPDKPLGCPLTTRCHHPCPRPRGLQGVPKPPTDADQAGSPSFFHRIPKVPTCSPAPTVISAKSPSASKSDFSALSGCDRQLPVDSTELSKLARARQLRTGRGPYSPPRGAPGCLWRTRVRPSISSLRLNLGLVGFGDHQFGHWRRPAAFW